MSRFNLCRSKDKQWYFTLSARNGEIISTSEMYKTKKSALNGIRSVKENAGNFDMKIIETQNWARDRGIYDKGTVLSQAQKALEEVNELVLGAKEGDRDKIMDGIGDTIVCLINTAYLADMSLTECLEYSLNEIKKRSGRMVDGIFVKNQ